MFSKLKMKLAKRHDVKLLAKLFTSVQDSNQEQEIAQMIDDKQVYVFKKRKNIKAAFTFSVLGIVGLCSFLYIRKIAVAKDAQGKGIGSFLVSKLKIFSRQRGVLGFFLYSLEKVKAFYQKNKLQGIGRIFWWRR